MSADGIKDYCFVRRHVFPDGHRRSHCSIPWRCHYHHDGDYHKHWSDLYCDRLLQRPGFLPADGNPVLYAGRQPDEVRRYLTKVLDFADALVGWITGSTGMVTVVASMFFAALSGSSPATVTAIGGITIPEMKREGYDPAYATAITAAAGTIGVIHSPQHSFCHLRCGSPVLHLRFGSWPALSPAL